ncbi:MAG: NAD-dependent epimerase/dehydratase family protein [Anaerolineales bacterium]|nr:NAD-dependent epimerase/dehydratase family protein [Anaerolineales bacterium]
MATYFVTGVAGFIASRVAEFLLEDGHKVVGVDVLDDGYDVRMKQYRLNSLFSKENFIFHKIDISDYEAVNTLTSEGPFDAVINLAARAGVRASLKDPWVYLSSNTQGTLNLLEFSHQNNIPKFVLASTSSIYGEDAPLPTPETADSSKPLQPYSASKKGAEAMCHAYHYLYGLDVTVVRYFTVYGPAGRPNMSIFRFVKWIYEGIPLDLYGDGEQTRGFTYLDDIARGTILALKPLGFEIINLGGHETISINDLIHTLEDMIGKKAIINQLPVARADMRGNHADVSKARKMLGWEPKVGLNEGLQQVVDWYRAEKDWATEINTD